MATTASTRIIASRNQIRPLPELPDAGGAPDAVVVAMVAGGDPWLAPSGAAPTVKCTCPLVVPLPPLATCHETVYWPSDKGVAV